MRAAAIRLARTLRAKALVPLLIARLDDDELRLRADARAALFDLTQRTFPDPKAWTAWWQKEGESFLVPEPSKAPSKPDKASATATYWNIPVTSDRITFVVDASGSMNQPFGTGGNTRLEEAVRQLERALSQLPPKSKANLVAFAADARAFQPKLATIDDKRRAALLAMAGELQARGPTNVAAALQLALGDAEVDTVFLLTDGQPSAGTIVDPEALAAAVRQWNRGRGVVIHTIALGGKSALLDRLARESGGEHTVAR